MFVLGDAELVDRVRIRQTNELDLLHDLKKSVDDAELIGEDLALLHAIGFDHLAAETILDVDDYLFFISCIETTWVHLLEAVEKGTVHL